MTLKSFWRTASTLAWRDLVGGPNLALLAGAAITVSVAATSAVADLGFALERSLAGNLRAWLGGDLAVVMFEPPNQEQTRALRTLVSKGIESTMIITAPAVATSDHAPDPLELVLKFVDPGAYPFYGNVALRSAKPFQAALTDRTVVLSDTAIEALKVHSGDEVRISGQPFVVAGIVDNEPDRFAGMPPLLGPHALLTPGALPITGVGRTTFLNYRIVLRSPYGQDLRSTRTLLENTFPDSQVLDYREPEQQAGSILETAIDLLRVLGMFALLFGAIAAASAIRSHLDCKLDMIAILRTLGARRTQIVTVFAIQAGLISLAGCAIGIIGAVLIERQIEGSIAKITPFDHALLHRPATLLAGAGLAMIAIGCAVLPSFLAAARIRPAVLLRRHVPARLPRIASGWTLRLHRLGIRSKSLVATLAAGMFTIVFAMAVRESLEPEIARQLPAPDYNLVIVGILRSAQSEIGEFMKHQPGLCGEVHSLTVAWLRLVAVDGRPIDGSFASRRVNRMWLSACESGMEDRAAGPDAALRMDQDLARSIGAQRGSLIEFRAEGHNIMARLTSTRSVRPFERIWFGLTFDCREFSGLNTVHHLYAYVEPAQLAPMIRALHARFPALTVGRSSDLFVFMDDVTRRGGEIVRVMSVLVVAAGMLVLMAIMVAWQSAHRREVAIFKVLGARRRKLILIISAELTRTGLLAVFIGAPLGYAASSLALSLLLQRGIIAVHGLPFLAGGAAAVAVANLGGWLIYYRLLDAKPLEVLRERG